MAPGDELLLLDGNYSVAEGTGGITYLGTNSGQPPSGPDVSDVSHYTLVRALTPGSVTIGEPLFLGRSFRKDSAIVLSGLTFVGGGDLYNTSFVTVRDSGFHGPFSIGTNDHDQGNDFDLIEDCWIWAAGARIIAINYRSNHNVWRRVVVRGDGCGTAECTGSGNPNVGITVYNSTDVSLQNVLVLDRVLAPGDEPYADFAVAQHAPGPAFGRAEWLGTISLNGPDTGYYMEPDVGGTVDPTIHILNAVAWNPGGAGVNLARSGTHNLLEHLTVGNAKGDGVRIAPELSGGTLRNVVVAGATRYAVNSAYVPEYVDAFGAGYNQTSCATGCLVSDPRADGSPPSLRYLTRIEAGSLLAGRGLDGTDLGATVLQRYGVDGSRHGDPNFDSLTTTPLWPWPNEARIKREMCASTSRGFCTSGTRLDGVSPVTLTSYVWEALGNALPPGIYP